MQLNLKKLLLIWTFLMATSSMAEVYPFSENNSIEPIFSTKESLDQKVDMIRRAKHHIHIMTYYVDKTNFPQKIFLELAKANERGVEVRFLATQNASLPGDLLLRAPYKYHLRGKTETVYSIQYLKSVEDILLFNNIHEKLFLIDGQEAIVGGRNITDSIYKAKDFEVLIKGDVVKGAQAHFEKMFNFVLELNKRDRCNESFGLVDDRCNDQFENDRFHASPDLYYPHLNEKMGEVKMRVLTNEAVLNQVKFHYSSDERENAKDDILEAVINTSFHEMQSYLYFIMPTERFDNFIKKNLTLNNKISIITNGPESSKFLSDKCFLYSLPKLQNLTVEGVNFYFWKGQKPEQYLHEKLIIFDREHLFIGSHNFGFGSTMVSSEIELEVFSKDLGEMMSKIFDKEINDKGKTEFVTNESAENLVIINQSKTQFYRNSSILSLIIKQLF